MKKSVIYIVAALSAAIFLGSCATTKKSDVYATIYSEKPEVFLIMPPINNSNYVEAKDCFYTTMNVPLAEAGYYVLPPAAVYDTMQRESAYDSERFIDGSLKKFNQLFGCDVAVFTIIKSWDKSLVGSAIVIEIEYIFKSAKTDEVLFRRDATIKCDTSTGASTNSLLGALIIAAVDAVKTAVSEYVDVAARCNITALSDLPAGKYSPKYGIDGAESAMGAKITITASK